jgi:hypothetical protein
LYEKWDYGVTTKNEQGRKIYKRFYKRERALEYMNTLLSKGKWAVCWDITKSPKFFYFEEVFKGKI